MQIFDGAMPKVGAGNFKRAAAQLVEYFEAEVPEVRLSLWLESEDNPLHHYHVTVFSDADAVQPVRESEAIRKFTQRLYPHIDHATFVSPSCNVWLVGGEARASIGAKR